MSDINASSNRVSSVRCAVNRSLSRFLGSDNSRLAESRQLLCVRELRRAIEFRPAIHASQPAMTTDDGWAGRNSRAEILSPARHIAADTVWSRNNGEDGRDDAGKCQVVVIIVVRGDSDRFSPAVRSALKQRSHFSRHRDTRSVTALSHEAYLTLLIICLCIYFWGSAAKLRICLPFSLFVFFFLS